MAKALFYVGTCNRALPYFATSNGKGIAAFRLDTETGMTESLGVTEGIDNPTFLAVSSDGKSLSATSEVLGWNEGTITAYAISPADGALTYLDKQPTRGDIAAHLSYAPDGRFVASVNYAVMPMTAKPNRSFAVYPRDAEGALGAPVAEAAHSGIGQDPVRQDRPHAHCVRWSPDGRFLVIADLGIDKLVVHRFDAASGAVTPHGAMALPAGSGPRHFAFHPTLPFAYSVNELASTVASLSFDATVGTFSLLGVSPTVPEPALSHNHCSAIRVAPSGRHLYVGNRGHDSIGCLAIDPSSGVATLSANIPCGGKTPRDFDFDPSGCVFAVANQDSDSVQMFRYEPTDGGLEPLGTGLGTGTPTAISFYPRLM